MRNKLFADTAYSDESCDVAFTDATGMSAASVTFALANLVGKDRELGRSGGNRFLIALVRLKVSIERDCITLVATA